MIPNLILFFGASILLALAPGPDNIFVLTQSATQGRKAGICVALGLCTGLIFHTMAVALGVATFFQKSSLAFILLKSIGGAYLLFLAWQSLKSSSLAMPAASGLELKSFQKLYLRGVIMNMTNPKVTLFFLAFLPQFVIPTRGSVAFQIVVLGLIFMIATILIFVSIAIMAGTLAKTLIGSPQAMSRMNKVAAAIFVLLAVKLVIS